jgi:hypothetical protein
MAGQGVLLIHVSLDAVQPPSSDWAWHSSEWLIDMVGDGMVGLFIVL